MLKIDGQPLKRQILTVVLPTCQKSTVKDSIEKSTLRYFVYLSTIPHPRLHIIMKQENESALMIKLTVPYTYPRLLKRVLKNSSPSMRSAQPQDILYRHFTIKTGNENTIFAFSNNVRTANYWMEMASPLDV